MPESGQIPPRKPRDETIRDDKIRAGKILTISYGSFFCGLEGFEDPLRTMTAILDYLRYLEAIDGDGGSAGAPDIDILTGIAARGMTRGVAVEMHEGGILLRAVPAQTADPPAGKDTRPAPPEGYAVEGHAREKPHPGDHACATAARVLRVRRAELEQLMTRGVRQDDMDLPGDAPPHDAAETSRFTGAEIELQRDLAGIEADPAPDRTGDTNAPDDLSRIFEATDSHLGSSASSRRRNAIQHLRAALAATRAETRGSSQPRPARDDKTGRAGLHIPAQCEPGAPPADRPADPLRLTSEQRIDASPAPAQVLAPPDGAGLPADKAPEGFGAFIARVDADSLPHLIEAAAAYLADIEGRTRFSRPMLMEKLDQIGVARMCEDVLCACDSLLDEGKLRQCPDGRYAITDITGFRTAPGTNPGQSH